METQTDHQPPQSAPPAGSASEVERIYKEHAAIAASYEARRRVGGFAMSPEAQRIAIAEACGWKRIEQYPEARTDGSDNWIEDYMGSKNGVRTCIPDYLHDLNACHEMEKVLNYEQLKTYRDLVKEANGCGVRFFCATASQRCEAFLRTLGLWREPSS